MERCNSCHEPGDLLLPRDWRGWNATRVTHICRSCVASEMEHGHRHVHDHAEDCVVQTTTVDGESYRYSCPGARVPCSQCEEVSAVPGGSLCRGCEEGEDSC